MSSTARQKMIIFTCSTEQFARMVRIFVILHFFSHQIDEMLLPSPIFESCDINGTLRLKQLFIIHKLCVWPVLHFQLWTLWLSSNQRYHGRSPKRFEAVVTCGERQLPGFSNKSIRWT